MSIAEFKVGESFRFRGVEVMVLDTSSFPEGIVVEFDASMFSYLRSDISLWSLNDQKTYVMCFLSYSVLGIDTSGAA